MSVGEKIREACAAVGSEHELAAAWIFGSEAVDRTRPDSDLDVGLLFSTLQDREGLHELRVELERSLRREVDLVDLTTASPLLAFQVVTHGRLILDEQPFVRANFVASLQSRRYDLLRVRRDAERRMLEGFNSG